jgi:hypothetical protein
MNLTFNKDHVSTMDGLTTPIFNEDGDLGDDEVGEIRFEKGVGRHITLYSRYKGTVKSHEECEAFIKGVQTVLEYMIGWRLATPRRGCDRYVHAEQRVTDLGIALMDTPASGMNGAPRPKG